MVQELPHDVIQVRLAHHHEVVEVFLLERQKCNGRGRPVQKSTRGRLTRGTAAKRNLREPAEFSPPLTRERAFRSRCLRFQAHRMSRGIAKPFLDRPFQRDSL
jgi:hypothetical protein